MTLNIIALNQSPDQASVILASDSKVSAKHGDKREGHIENKIHQSSQNTVVALAGTLPKEGSEPKERTIQSLTQDSGKSLLDINTWFQKIKADLEAIYQRLPDARSFLVRLAGFNKDEPIVQEVKFSSSGVEKKDLIPKPDYSDPDTGTKLWLQGETQPITDFLAQMTDSKWGEFIDYIHKNNPSFETANLELLREELKPGENGAILRPNNQSIKPEDLPKYLEGLTKFAIEFRAALHDPQATEDLAISKDQGSIGYPVQICTIKPNEQIARSLHQ